MTNEINPTVTAQMLIRRPATELFTAFVDPAITTQFWFTKSSGVLEEGGTVQWEWEMYGASAPVFVKSLEPGKRILIEWGDPANSVEWRFEERPDKTTMVHIATWGFRGNQEEITAAAIDAKGGFTSVLASLKAFLEHGINLNLVADQHPDAHVG